MIGTRRVRSVPAHEFGQLEAVHLGHLHVEQGQGNVVLQEQLQRFGAGARLQQHESVATQQAFQRQQVFLEIVDQKKIDGSDLGRHHAPASRRYAAISFTDRTRASGHAAIAARGIADA